MSAADALGLPPGVRFDPTPEELVEFYLVPRALGLPTAVPGIIIDDDDDDAEATTSSSRHPWKLLSRHRRTHDDEAYFFERIDASAAKGGAAARQDRSCGGGQWTWVGQKRCPDEALVLSSSSPRGEQEQGKEQEQEQVVSWGKYSLNLQEGRRKGGSTGWVMHEYTITGGRPPCACPVKLCHVAFTGHGQKRQRIPDDDDDDDDGTTTHQHKQKRVATASSSVVTTATAEQDQERRPFPNPNYYEASSSSSVASFWGSADAGFSQESSITILDDYPWWYPDAGSSHQEPCSVLDQELALNQEYFSNQPQAAYRQEQFMNYRYGVPSGQPLTDEEQLRLQLDQLSGGISPPYCLPIEPVTVSAAAAAAYHEEHIPLQTMAAPAATVDLAHAQNQEYFSNQPQAYHQEQFMNYGYGVQSGQPLTDEEQLRLQLDQLSGGISPPYCLPIEPVTVSAAAAADYHEEHIPPQTMAPAAATVDLPLPMDQEPCTTEQPHGGDDMDNNLHEFFEGWGDLDTFTNTSGLPDYDDGMAAGTVIAGDGPTVGTGNFAVAA